MNYHTVYATHHSSILVRWFAAYRCLYPANIYEYNARSAFVYDEYDVTGNNIWQADRVAAHINTDATSGLYLNLSSENCTPNPVAMASFHKFLATFPVEPQKITVISSQQDVLDYCAAAGVATQLRNLWETHTALVVERNPIEPLEPTHRLSCLNRRYSPERAIAIHTLWPHRQNLYYTLGKGAAWSDDEPREYQLAEWKRYNPEQRDQVMQWQDREQPWRNLNQLVDHTEWDTHHLLQHQRRGAVSLVVESRIRSRTPRSDAFVTEKTYRCFALGIPTLVIGQPNIKHTLKRQGYKLPKGDALELAQQIVSESNNQFRTRLQTLEQLAQHNLENFRARTAAKR